MKVWAYRNNTDYPDNNTVTISFDEPSWFIPPQAEYKPHWISDDSSGNFMVFLSEEFEKEFGFIIEPETKLCVELNISPTK